MGAPDNCGPQASISELSFSLTYMTTIDQGPRINSSWLNHIYFPPVSRRQRILILLDGLEGRGVGFALIIKGQGLANPHKETKRYLDPLPFSCPNSSFLGWDTNYNLIF